ncbi:unnamed protein product [Didymodactylos carnosus]|uniref:N-formylglutamate amidohydrolase n=1 Tax=Didymodactylos carnosus TaxID=1234261 RepID=A0A814N7T3_9BILA|nr:unnamed protein product [Didymodactylos carnosus]CAF1212576.1 unnamed protein product [Didymodactylos carnosus]CAF3855290.1 unnamed protein product [Didymodactylos carnosus]CAF4021470.1 unnamed protein product [Didymodactylos carnosus]
MISAPHGGGLFPDNIPNRTRGCLKNSTCVWSHDVCNQSSTVNCQITTVRDTITDEFAQNVAKQLVEMYNLHPFLVIGQWNRKIVDFNREISEATFNHPEAMSGYQSYHQFLSEGIRRIENQYGKGLLLDIHGHIQGNYTMVGYLLTSADLNNENFDNVQTSIEQLLQSSTDRRQSVIGDNSFGSILEENDLSIVYPSRMNPKPGQNRFYAGGYITQHYRSSKMNVIQTELSYEILGANEEKEYAKKYAQSVYQFMVKNNLLVSQSYSIFVSSKNVSFKRIVLLMMTQVLTYWRISIKI